MQSVHIPSRVHENFCEAKTSGRKSSMVKRFEAVPLLVACNRNMFVYTSLMHTAISVSSGCASQMCFGIMWKQFWKNIGRGVNCTKNGVIGLAERVILKFISKMQLTNPAVHTYTIRNNTNTILYEFVKPI
jgi:hypothetical protein